MLNRREVLQTMLACSIAPSLRPVQAEEWTHDWSKGTHRPGRMFAIYNGNRLDVYTHEVLLPVVRFNERTNTIEYYDFKVLKPAHKNNGVTEGVFLDRGDGNLLTRQLRYTTQKLVFYEGMEPPKERFRCVGVKLV